MQGNGEVRSQIILSCSTCSDGMLNEDKNLTLTPHPAIAKTFLLAVVGIVSR